MTESVYKLEIFLPEDHFDPICQALWSVDAGHIGQYDRCLSWSRVNSCWRPLAGTDPYLGQPGQLDVYKRQKYFHRPLDKSGDFVYYG